MATGPRYGPGKARIFSYNATRITAALDNYYLENLQLLPLKLFSAEHSSSLFSCS
jgi:hypothetical protein